MYTYILNLLIILNSFFNLLINNREFQAKECQNHLENAIVSKLPVEILVGKKNLEVRPMSINKGEIVKKILSQHPDADLAICAGNNNIHMLFFPSILFKFNNFSSFLSLFKKK